MPSNSASGTSASRLTTAGGGGLVPAESGAALAAECPASRAAALLCGPVVGLCESNDSPPIRTPSKPYTPGCRQKQPGRMNPRRNRLRSLTPALFERICRIPRQAPLTRERSLSSRAEANSGNPQSTCPGRIPRHNPGEKQGQICGKNTKTVENVRGISKTDDRESRGTFAALRQLRAMARPRRQAGCHQVLVSAGLPGDCSVRGPSG